jgi:hypothetical protein
MPSFIIPQEAFSNYEDGGDVDISDECDGVTFQRKILLNSAGRKVTRDYDESHGTLFCLRACMVRTRRMFGRDHRGRFVYPNGWSTTTSRMSICKEDDVNWSMTREQQYNNLQITRDPIMNLFISLVIMAVLSVIAGNLLPR